MRISLSRARRCSHGTGFGVAAGAQPGAAQPTAPRTASAAALHHGRGLVCVAAVVAATVVATAVSEVAAAATSAPALMAIGRRTAGTAVAAAAAYSRRRRCCCDSSTVCEELPRCTTVAQELRAELLGSARFDRRVRWAV